MVGSVLVELNDPLLFRYPVSYMSEPGGWHASDKDVASMRAYLLKGGFMIFDDFREGWRGDYDFTNLKYEMARVLPKGKWVQLTGKRADLRLVLQNRFEAGGELHVRVRHQFADVLGGIYQDNDPKKRMMVTRQRRQRHRRVVAVVGLRVRSDRCGK